MDASQSITSLPGTLPKGHIRSLHSFKRSHPFLVSFGDATVRWYPLDLTPFGRDTSSPVSYQSQPTRVSDDRTTQLGQYLISSPSSVELLRTNRLETSIELGLDRSEDKDIPIIDMEHLDMEKLREAYKDWGISHLTGIPLINVDVLSPLFVLSISRTSIGGELVSDLLIYPTYQLCWGIRCFSVTSSISLSPNYVYRSLDYIPD
ncbi:hypothetical protein AXX17_AT3G41210 [Arabidopsis thaliana]|uniref:Uncharacterized protein n=1 Tax=Arabidopsis thaliana TaxID=3702 RepID=A0A178V924_ARATH|nr:hypothetical protein AXX17_AT3G41210 [Arabidopsis thaliana]